MAVPDPLLPTPPIRERSSRDQYVALRELRESSVALKRIRMLQMPARFILYFGMFYYVAMPMMGRLGIFWFVIIVVGTMWLIDELFWRLVMVPLMDKELARLHAEGKLGYYRASEGGGE